MSNKRLLIAGGSGLAGLSILTALAEKIPDLPVSATFYHTAPQITHPQITWIKANLTTRAGCQKVVEGCSDVIMVCANGGGIASTSTNQIRQMTDNLVMDTLLLEAMCDAKMKRAIYVSSALVYQDITGLIKEDMLDMNINPGMTYAGIAWCKRAAEKLCWVCHEKQDMETIIVRSSNIYGPFAKFDPARSNFIPALIRKAVDKMDPFEVWGSPEVERDVIFSADFADAILAIYCAKSIRHDVFNLGYGSTVTVGRVVDRVLQAADHQPSQVVYHQSQFASPKGRHLDCSKLHQIVGWKPQYTPEEGIAHTVEWWCQHQHTWQK